MFKEASWFVGVRGGNFQIEREPQSGRFSATAFAGGGFLPPEDIQRRCTQFRRRFGDKALYQVGIQNFNRV